MGEGRGVVWSNFFVLEDIKVHREKKMHFNGEKYSTFTPGILMDSYQITWFSDIAFGLKLLASSSSAGLRSCVTPYREKV